MGLLELGRAAARRPLSSAATTPTAEQPQLYYRNPSFGPGTKDKGVVRLRAERKPENQGKKKPGSHITYSRECKKVWGSVREWTLTLPRQLPLWEMESRSTPETSESDLRGQTSMSCGVLYIIGKLLELRYLKWARIANSNIWKHKLWPKEGSGVELPVWLPTTKSRESTRFT